MNPELRRLAEEAVEEIAGMLPIPLPPQLMRRLVDLLAGRLGTWYTERHPETVAAVAQVERIERVDVRP